jgi:hypothetical protein
MQTIKHEQTIQATNMTCNTPRINIINPTVTLLHETKDEIVRSVLSTQYVSVSELFGF